MLERFFVTLFLGARKVYFDLPKLERKLLKHVTNQRQYGRAVLTFGRVELGHQGTYVCHAVNRRGDRESRTFDMVVYPEERPWKTTEELAQVRCISCIQWDNFTKTPMIYDLS